MSEFIYTDNLDKIRRIKSRVKVVCGGTSAGKTFAILSLLIDRAIKNPGLEISVVSSTIPHLRRGAVKDFLKIMKQTSRYNDKCWNKTLLTYTFNNDSFIEFFSVEDESKLRGARRNILYVNECNNILFESYQQLAIRTSGEIFLDYNPSSLFWVDTEILGKKDNASKITLTYKGNNALPKSIVEELESHRILALTSDYWKNWCRVYLDGETGLLEGVIFSDWKTVDKIPEDAELLGYGMDFGFTNDPTTLVALYRYNGELIVDELIYQTGLLSGDIANRIKELNCKLPIIADSAEPRTIAEIKNRGINIKGIKKPSINESLHLLLEYKINITKSSTNLINEFQNYKWDDKKTNTPIGVFNHCIDALRYIGWERLGVKQNNKIKYKFI